MGVAGSLKTAVGQARLRLSNVSGTGQGKGAGIKGILVLAAVYLYSRSRGFVEVDHPRLA